MSFVKSSSHLRGDYTNYRYTYPPFFWITVFLGSISLHLLALWLLGSSDQFGFWFPLSSQKETAIDFIYIPSPTESTQSQSKDVEVKSKQESLPQQSVQDSLKLTPSTSQKLNEQVINSGLNLSPQVKNKNNQVANQGVSQSVKPKPKFTPKTTTQEIFTPKPIPKGVLKPIPRKTTPLNDLPWNRREDIKLGKATPLPDSNIIPKSRNRNRRTSLNPNSRTSPNPNPQTSPNPNPQTSPNPNSRTSPNPNPQTSPNPNPKTSLNPNPKTSLNPNPKTSLNPNPKTSPNPNPQTSPNPNPKTSLNPNPKTSPNPNPRTSPNPNSRTSPNPNSRTSPNPNPRTSPNPNPRTSPNPNPRTSPNPNPRTSPNPNSQTSPNPNPRTSPIVTGGGIIAKVTPILKDKVEQLRQQQKLRVGALPDVMAKYQGSAIKELELNFIPSDSVLKPANILASLVIDKNGNFQQAIVINIEPTTLSVEKNIYEQALNQIFKQDRFVAGYNKNGSKPELSNLYVEVKINPRL